MTDESIRFMPGGSAVVTVVVDQDLGQWLCRQSVLEGTGLSVGLFVLRILRRALLEHAQRVSGT